MAKKEENIEKKDLPLGLKLKHLTVEWIQGSTSHGLPNVFRTDQIYLKIIWFLCFLASTTGCVYIVVNYIMIYLKYSVNVSTTIETETPIDFPAITVCNLNPFNSARSIWFMKFILNMNNLAYTLNLTTLNTINAEALLTNVSSILKAEAAGHPMFNTTTRKSFGFYLDEMLVSCRFGESECSSNDFSYFRSYDYGNCYTFNSGKYANGTAKEINKISTSGPGHGLQLELNAGNPDDEYFTLNRGFYVVIHNSSYTPIMDNEGVHVGLGQQTNIGIDRSFYYKLGDQYSNCVKDPTTVSSNSSSILYQAILTTLQEKTYRQRYCYKLCYQEKVINECSCYDAVYANPFPRSKGQAINSCHTADQITCMIKARTAFESSNINIICNDDCPEECNSVTYATTVSTSSYPSDFYLKWLLLQSSLTSKLNPNGLNSLSTQIKNSIAKVNVFYNNIDYNAFTESPTITWDSLLGNVGGQLGLFIGISLLSLVEILEVIFELLRTMYLHIQTKKSIKDSELKS